MLMRQYELMVVVKNDFPHQDEKKRISLVEKLLGGQQYKDLVVEDFGKRLLAYPIKKQTEGCYLLAKFSSSQVSVAVIEQQVKLLDSVLRYLLTRTD
ncbi:MAG: 30S ribosomal protein S6 [Patescibacteria group bacterium]|nr:30S ribosomal protein S6 [Patescibacteria group bacterium]